MRENKYGVVSHEEIYSGSGRILTVILFFLPGISLMSLGIYSFMDACALNGLRLNSLLYILLCVFPGSLLITIAYKIYMKLYSTIDICRTGIVVTYPLGKGLSCNWNRFQEVCVCYTSRTTRGISSAYVVICFVCYGEKKNMMGRWKTENPFHYRSVIVTDYSDYLYQELEKKCPLPVSDLRNSHAYRL